MPKAKSVEMETGDSMLQSPKRHRLRIGAAALVASIMPFHSVAERATCGEDVTRHRKAGRLALQDNFRISTYNLAKGRWGWNNVSQEIARQKSDVVCIQEVTANGLPKVAEQAGYKHVIPGWSKKGFGNAILTNLQVVKSKTYALDAKGDSSPRSMVVAVLRTTGDQTVIIGASHLSADTRDDGGQGKLRARQARQILDTLSEDYVQQYPEADIVSCGDFNARRGSAAYNIFSRRYYNAAEELQVTKSTYPQAPGAQIDHIFSGNGLRPIEVTVWGGGASDHCGVTAGLVTEPNSYDLARTSPAAYSEIPYSVEGTLLAATEPDVSQQ